MNCEFKAPHQKKCVFTDNGFSIGKKTYNYSDITEVKLFSESSKFVNGLIQMIINGKLVQAFFPFEQQENGMAVYQYLQNIVAHNKHKNSPDTSPSLTTAKEIYDYCINQGLGSGFNESWGLRHFQIIIDNLMKDENIIFPFIGLHNYKSIAEHDNHFAYAVTNKRILMAQQKVIGQVFQSVSWKNINDITFSSGLVIGILTIDTYKETFNVGLDKYSAQTINTRIHEVFEKVKNDNINTTELKSNLSTNIASSYDELIKSKELLDAGILTQDEFDMKKKQILGL